MRILTPRHHRTFHSCKIRRDPLPQIGRLRRHFGEHVQPPTTASPRVSPFVHFEFWSEHWLNVPICWTLRKHCSFGQKDALLGQLPLRVEFGGKSHVALEIVANRLCRPLPIPQNVENYWHLAGSAARAHTNTQRSGQGHCAGIVRTSCNGFSWTNSVKLASVAEFGRNGVVSTVPSALSKVCESCPLESLPNSTPLPPTATLALDAAAILEATKSESWPAQQIVKKFLTNWLLFAG